MICMLHTKHWKEEKVGPKVHMYVQGTYIVVIHVDNLLFCNSYIYI